MEPFWTFDLMRYHWRSRPLLVFAAGDRDPQYAKLAGELSARTSDMAERDVVVVTCLGTRDGHVREFDDPAGGEKLLTVEDVEALRLRFDVELNDFCMVLIGLDGTEKRRDAEAVPLDDLFAEIDAMPMRREEMGGG